ncbi:hypothetical protein SMB34_03510 [Thalassospira permensis NBRC 106175]|uniref:Uncharacterized protein n=1 Tax=Thalassospira permensis NBRC 106175 TaxID=1353532 RepID=A0ABR4TQ61_9PROT|nr:hypothetical protein SMB34_03510 [Thalassospira permensis NBRC 106175]
MRLRLIHYFVTQLDEAEIQISDIHCIFLIIIFIIKIF